MGQKIHPTGFRLAVSRNWSSRWYANNRDFAGMLGEDDESLMVIECMPALETRNYVEKVMVAYWTYRQKFGQDNTTLDAIASGERYVDVRLDR